MDEKPKSIWKKSWHGARSLLLAWLGLMIVTWIVFFVITLAMGARITGEEIKLWAVLSLCATIVVFLVLFIRWLCCWRNFKRFLFGLACFATLIALFYAEEDWRGWHAWNSFKREWTAKGEAFDMAGVTPPPVPDEQNFALTPVVASCYSYILTRDGKRIPNNQRDTNLVDRLEFEIYHRKNPSIPKLEQPETGNWTKGELTDLLAWQNYYRVASYTNRLDPDMPVYRSFSNGFPITAQPQTPPADVLLALSKYDATVEELRQASLLPKSRFPLNYDCESPSAILLPQLAAMKRTSQLLQLRAIAELQNGQSEQALADVKLSLRLTEAIRTEPFLISHLVRIAMMNILLQPIYEGLAEHKWSDAQLVVLEAELNKLDFPADYRLSMRGELGCLDDETDRLRRHPEDLWMLAMGNDEGKGYRIRVPSGFVARLIPSGWFYQNQYRYARMMVDYYIPLADVNLGTFVPALARRGEAALKADTKSASPYNVLERLMLNWLGEVVPKFSYAQAAMDLARTAIALERYRLAHGEFPESLDAFAPQFIATVPHDVIGGGPLKYRRESNGQFVLYSIGWNEKDDGGVVVNQKSRDPRDESNSKVDISQGDWVWRYPAK